MVAKKFIENKENIVVKGGDWKSPGNHRMSFHPDSSSYNIGFRCVLSSSRTLP
jgi:formylglycine-generating enzyme required for sulfatase activity